MKNLTAQTPGAQSILKERPIWILILFGILYFYRPVFLGDVFYFRDLHSHFLPKKQLAAEYYSRLELPLWDPYLQGGKPLLANPNNMALYPSIALYIWMPAHRALTIEILLHWLAGTVAMYVLARILGFIPSASLVAAAVFSYCGYSLSSINLLNWLVASTYIPLLICSWHLCMLNQSWRWGVVSVLLASLQLVAGAPELSILTMILLLGWTLFYPCQSSRVQKMIRWLGLCVFTAGVAAIQILPTLEISKATIRSIGFGFDSATIWSLHPYRTAEFLFHGILGRFDSFSQTSFWGQPIVGGDLPFFLSIYFGLPAIALAFCGTFLRSESFPRSVRRYLAIVILLSVLFAFGKYLPGLKALFETLSLRIAFRFPVKWIALGIVPFALLAGYGLQILTSSTNKAHRIFLWIVAAMLLLLFLLLALHSGIVDAIASTMHPGSESTRTASGLQMSALHTLFFWTAFAAFCQTGWRWKEWGLAAVVVADLAIAGNAIKLTGPASIYTQTPRLASIVQEALKDGKLFRGRGPSLNSLRAPTDHAYWKSIWQQEILAEYLGSKYRIPVIFHDDLDASSLMELNYMRLVIGSLPWQSKLAFLSAAGVKLILTPEKLQVDGIRLIGRMEGRGTLPLSLYENIRAVPSASFVANAVYARNARDAFQRMARADYDPTSLVILNEALAGRTGDCTQASIKMKSFDLQTREYQVAPECNGYMVFGDPHYPGWQVYVDGRKQQLIAANGIYSAVFLSEGNHQVKKVYAPKSVDTGAIISGAVLVALIALLLKRRGGSVG